MQILLTGFLNGKNARIFMSELWELLISAQDSLSGIPEKFLELKKEELKKKVVCVEFKSWPALCLIRLISGGKH